MNTPTWTLKAPTTEGFYWLAYQSDKRVYELRRHNGGLKVAVHTPLHGAVDQPNWDIPERLHGARWLGPIDMPPGP